MATCTSSSWAQGSDGTKLCSISVLQPVTGTEQARMVHGMLVHHLSGSSSGKEVCIDLG